MDIKKEFERWLVNATADMDKTVNRHGATLLFSTHYCEVLDLFNRQDNIWVCQSSDKIAIKNMYESFEVRSGLLKSKRFYNNAFQTAVNYDELMNLKRKLIPDAEVPYRFHFTPEDFYVFVIAHAYKHYSRSGTGIRTLADIYIMNQKLGGTLNWEYVDSELRGLGIFSYEHESRELARKIFGIAELPTKANLSEAEQQMLAYYLGASTYGTIENRILNQMQKLQPDDGAFTARTKRKYLLSRIFPGREWCEAYAPTVYKYPVLLPFFWVWRLIYKGITNRKKVTQEIKTIKAGKQN